MREAYIAYMDRRRRIQATIDRVWNMTEPHSVEFRDKLFPGGKPGVIGFVLRLRVHIYWNVAKKLFNIIVFDMKCLVYWL